MKVACICCTYKRPEFLAEAIESYLRQDYPKRELIVLDDAGQYGPDALEHYHNRGVRLVVSHRRFRTVGEKRNATAALAAPDADVYCVWDDDDIYLPHHVSECVESIRAGHDYAIPSRILFQKRSRPMFAKSNSALFHGSWAFTRSAFAAVNGYPWIQSGQDQGLRKRFEQAKMRKGDPLQDGAPPSYIYRWQYRPNAWHLSARGQSFDNLASKPARHVDKLEARWDRDWVKLSLDR